MTSEDLPATPPAARLLDLSRLCSVVGKGPFTGIDRVEANYLTETLAAPEPLFALVRTNQTFSLLDPAGTAALAERALGKTPWGRADWRARLRRKARPELRAVQADLRRLAIAQCGPQGLAETFRRHLPDDTAWINVGQLNLLHPAVFAAIHALPGGRATVLLHDLIPFTHPEFMVADAAEKFVRKIRHVSQYADLVICNTAATEADVAHHMGIMGRVPPSLVAHLGIDMPHPDASALPELIAPARPFFVILSTIEPRKNHALLLDIWEHYAATLPEAEIPSLVIVGRRGWMNEDLFARLDSSPLMGRHVFEMSGLADGAVAALIAGAHGLLMPSIIEGFGLPPGEAMLLGTPALVNDLPVYREVFGNNLIYANVTDMYSWAEKILDLARADKKGHMAADGTRDSLPTWHEHFNLVLKVT